MSATRWALATPAASTLSARAWPSTTLPSSSPARRLSWERRGHVSRPPLHLTPALHWPSADTHYFLDPANHKDNKPPDIISNHAFFNSGASSFFTGVDEFMPAVHDLVAERDAKAPKTELVLNEFIPVVQVRSCQPGGGSDAAVAPCLLVHVGSPLLPAEHESTTALC